MVKPQIAARALLALFLGASSAAFCAQSRASFEVSVKLAPQDDPSQVCRITDSPTAHGATVLVICSTGVVVDVLPGAGHNAPMHGAAYRFRIPGGMSSDLIGAVDFYAGAGTVTSWRVVSYAGREFVEMMVGW